MKGTTYCRGWLDEVKLDWKKQIGEKPVRGRRFQSYTQIHSFIHIVFLSWSHSFQARRKDLTIRHILRESNSTRWKEPTKNESTKKSARPCFQKFSNSFLFGWNVVLSWRLFRSCKRTGRPGKKRRKQQKRERSQYLQLSDDLWNLPKIFSSSICFH